jgi:branched-chain amino acid transport system permease protein
MASAGVVREGASVSEVVFQQQARIAWQRGSLASPYKAELILLGVGVLGLFVFPSDLGLLTRIAIMSLFVLSLSFVLGQAGILTLGHAAFFGTGAYAAGLFAKHLSSDPIVGLLAGGAAGLVAALISGFLVLRAEGLALLMMTVAVSQILMETANKLGWITGGDDGLADYSISPIFELFRFDMFGRTGYLYALVVLVASYFVLNRIAASPFGLTSRGIRSDPGRMTALGCSVYRHLVITYTIGGFFAGIAGALSAQTAGVVGLNSFGFLLSAEALVMVVLGGTLRLSGAVVGTIVFMVVHHVTSTVNPFHWLLVIGIMLVGTVLLLPAGIISTPKILRLVVDKSRMRR